MGKPFFRYEYTGFFGCQCQCNLEIYGNLVICSEREDNGGTSITNMAEHLATDICKQFDISPNQLIWIEHYPPTVDSRGYVMHEESWSWVSFNLTGGGFFDAKENGFAFSNPRWGHIEKVVVDTLIETHKDLAEQNTAGNIAHLAYYANRVLEALGQETLAVAFWRGLYEGRGNTSAIPDDLIERIAPED